MKIKKIISNFTFGMLFIGGLVFSLDQSEAQETIVRCPGGNDYVCYTLTTDDFTYVARKGKGATVSVIE